MLSTLREKMDLIDNDEVKIDKKVPVGNTKKIADARRKAIWLATTADFCSSSYFNHPIISYSVTGKDRTVFPSLKFDPESTKKATIYIFNESSHELVYDFHSVCKTSALQLIFGSVINIYGGLSNGGCGQLEDICLATDLAKIVGDNFDTFHKPNTDPKFPPRVLSNRAFYIPQIYMYLDEEFKILREPFTYSGFMIFPVRYPKKKLERLPSEEGFDNRKELFANERDEKYTRAYLELFFKVALMKGYESLVIGAPGCGSYDGPVYHVALILKELVQKYQCHFKHIGFPILVRNERDQRNLDIFKEVFQS